MVTDANSEFAPAKINLCLHVIDRRADGYHLLDSLVVFAEVGDRLSCKAGSGLMLEIEGPEAGGLTANDDNLVLRAARVSGVKDLVLRLWKELPVASGIGGGSADAAATLRAIARRSGKAVSKADVVALGADVPVCLAGRPARMRGIGEVLSALPELPPLWCVLVNPRVAIPTPQVFAALKNRQNPSMPDPPSTGWSNAEAFAGWLKQNTRNDLERAAREIAPVLTDVDATINATPGCLMSRMSGSGATFFGLFGEAGAAKAAAFAVRATRPGWWVADAGILD
jgi:4-diphosphocytidyl-2-C-methyl-D-erythritol kinase